jgi:hypothetical protein
MAGTSGVAKNSHPTLTSLLHCIPRHLLDRSPDILKLLGLPPGYRFLMADDYLNIWYDESLLDV